MNSFEPYTDEDTAGVSRWIESMCFSVLRWLANDALLAAPWWLPRQTEAAWTADDAALIAAWAQQLAPNPAAVEPDLKTADLTPERKAKLRNLILRGNVMELDLAERKRAFIPQVDVERLEKLQCQALLIEMQSLSGLAIKMEGVDLQGRERMLETWARQTHTRFLNARIDE